MMMKRLVCPQCKMYNLYLKNPQQERRLIYVLVDKTIIPTKENESLDDFDIATIFCLGCSWSGSINKLVRY